MARSFGNGQGGKSLQDRELGAEVRQLTLQECRKYLKRGKGKMYEAVLLKLAGQVLPRLNEHTGEGGKDLFPEPIGKYVLETNNSNKEDRPFAQPNPNTTVGNSGG